MLLICTTKQSSDAETASQMTLCDLQIPQVAAFNMKMGQAETAVVQAYVEQQQTCI